MPDYYDNFVIGEEVGPVDITVDGQRIRDFIYAVDDFNPWYLFGSPFGPPIAPLPLLTHDDPEFAAQLETGPEDALAARYEVESMGPITMGQKVRLFSRNAAKYVRRGKAYIVREFVVTAAEDVRPLISSRLTEMVGIVSNGRIDEGTPDTTPSERIVARTTGLPPAFRATRDVEIGSPLPALIKRVSRKQLFVFSARPGWWSSIHTDSHLAQSFGFPDMIAQGLMSGGYVSQICEQFFQESWFFSGRMSLAFIRPVCVGDELKVEARVTSLRQAETGKMRLELDVWCRNQTSDLTTVGRASAVVE